MIEGVHLLAEIVRAVRIYVQHRPIKDRVRLAVDKDFCNMVRNHFLLGQSGFEAFGSSHGFHGACRLLGEGGRNLGLMEGETVPCRESPCQSRLTRPMRTAETDLFHLEKLR